MKTLKKYVVSVHKAVNCSSVNAAHRFLLTTKIEWNWQYCMFVLRTEQLMYSWQRHRAVKQLCIIQDRLLDSESLQLLSCALRALITHALTHIVYIWQLSYSFHVSQFKTSAFYHLSLYLSPIRHIYHHILVLCSFFNSSYRSYIATTNI